LTSFWWVNWHFITSNSCHIFRSDLHIKSNQQHSKCLVEYTTIPTADQHYEHSPHTDTTFYCRSAGIGLLFEKSNEPKKNTFWTYSNMKNICTYFTWNVCTLPIPCHRGRVHLGQNWHCSCKWFTAKTLVEFEYVLSNATCLGGYKVSI
jgi:hypothetical protein